MEKENVEVLEQKIEELRKENFELRGGHQEFTWLYNCSSGLILLEDLVQQYPELWVDALVNSFRFWRDSYAYDIIVEATEKFEEYLHEFGIDIEFVEQTDIICDYRILIGQFLGETTKEMEKLVDKNNALQVRNDRLRAENSKLRKKLEKYLSN